MPQQTIYPIRNGLQLPRGENLQAVEVFSEGGMDLTQSIIESKPGCALNLVNFEAGLKGGYRRINGFSPYIYAEVPGLEDVLVVTNYLSTTAIAGRRSAGATSQYNMYASTSNSWTKINTALELDYIAGMRIQKAHYNWTGTPIVTFADGVNPAYKWNGSVLTSLNGAGSPADPTCVIAFSGYLFLGGYSSNSAAVTISAPLDDTNYSTVDGAAEFIVGDTEVVGFGIWRAELIIFCKSSIWKISGNSTDFTSATPFKLDAITKKIGCVDGHTIQEVNGDIVFLANDGIRTISGTANIGDTETASISRPIQSIVSNINPNTNPCYSVVVRDKTQYRLFYPDPTQSATICKGVVGSVRRFRDGHEGWEWGQLQGIAPTCTDSRYASNGTEYVLFGAADGYVYQMESGSTFNEVDSINPFLYDDGNLYDDPDVIYDGITFSNTPIGELYETVPLELGDYGIRKALQRVTLYYYAEGDLNLYMQVIYDYDKPGTISPRAYSIAANVATNLYDTGLLYDNGVLYDQIIYPVKRQSVQGSGFITQLKFNSVDSSSYVIQGFYIEFFPAGRR